MLNRANVGTSATLKLALLLIMMMLMMMLARASAKFESSVSSSQAGQFRDIVHQMNGAQCRSVDTTKIGVAYVFLPDRFYRGDTPQDEKERHVFKRTNFYSLLLLSKMFKPSPTNRLLFFYVNSTGQPRSNHYNRWLTDPFWQQAIGLENVKFVELKFNATEADGRYDMYRIFSAVKSDSLRHLDNLAAKSHVIITTSDVLVGPKIQTCFSQGQTRKTLIKQNKPAFRAFNSGELRDQLTGECFESLHSNSGNSGHFSFLLSLRIIHHPYDFSGLFVWRLTPSEKRLAKGSLLDFRTYVEPQNNFKCHFKTDIGKEEFSNSFCVYGYEISSSQDTPTIEAMLFGDSYFQRLVRSYLYGRSGPISYSSSPTPSIPNVVHLIWFSSGQRGLKFIEYLCLKSIVRVLKPDKVRVHGDIEPVGDFWHELTSRPDSPIEWTYKRRQLLKYGQNFTSSPIQHLADVARLEVLYEHGGIYSDFDVLWVRSPDRLRHLNVQLVASNDITSYCDEFPNSIQIGAFLAAPKSPFVKQWLDGYQRKYHLFPNDYVAVSMCEPYKLYEEQPHVVYIDNRLQMIYFNGWNSFIPRYTDVPREQLEVFNSQLDWLNNGTYAYHLPRHGSLFTRENFEKADKTQLPIKIATYILNT